MTNLLKLHLTPLVLRLALGIIFLYHGYDKIMQEGGAGWGEKMNLPTYQQLGVAWGEFLGGAALVLGILSRLAAAGIALIMAGAIHMVHGANGFNLGNPGMGYEYHFALIAMCVAVILLGSGSFSLDHFGVRFWKKKSVPGK